MTAREWVRRLRRRSRTLPLIRAVVDAGPRDDVYDGLLLVSPLVIALIAVLGRSPVTVAVAVAYLAVLLGYVTYRGLTTVGE